MPGGDRTGPMGMGSRTGRAAGFCSGFTGPGAMNTGGGWGAGCGRSGARRGGFGMGRFGSPFPAGVAPAAPTREQTLESLKQQAAHFQDALADIQRQIDERAADSSSE